MSATAAGGTAATLLELKERLSAKGLVVPILEDAEQLASGPGLEATACVLHIIGRIPASLARLSAHAAARLVLFLEQPTESDLIELGTLKVAALLVKQGAFTVDEMGIAVEKILQPPALGILRYLPDATPVQRVAITQSTQRGEALEALDRFITSLTLDARRVAQVLTIADEFITNAFYHAPVDGTGRHPYTHLPRIDPVRCRPDRPVELSFANNRSRVALAVKDLFGSLDPTHVLRHLGKATSDPRANFKVTSGAGGARLGLITAYRASSQLIFNIIPEEVTECIGVLEMGGNYREFLEGGKSLQVFTLRPEAARS